LATDEQNLQGRPEVLPFIFAVPVAWSGVWLDYSVTAGLLRSHVLGRLPRSDADEPAGQDKFVYPVSNLARKLKERTAVVVGDRKDNKHPACIYLEGLRTRGASENHGSR
jgi:hypothetical protein